MWDVHVCFEPPHAPKIFIHTHNTHTHTHTHTHTPLTSRPDNKANQAWTDFTEEIGQNVHIVGDSFIQMVAAEDDGGGGEGEAAGDDAADAESAPVDRMKAAAMGKCCNGVTLRLAADFQTLTQVYMCICVYVYMCLWVYGYMGVGALARVYVL